MIKMMEKVKKRKVQVIFFMLGFVSCLFIMYLISQYNHNKTSRYTQQVERNIFDYHQRDTLNNPQTLSANTQIMIYTWTGCQWERLFNVCTLSVFPDCVMLKTQNGETPIFHHNPQIDYTSRLLVNFGVKEPETIQSVLKYMNNDYSITFLDIGSHIGSITLQIAKAGYKVVAVDPLPENVGRLCKSVEAGNLSSNVTILWSPVSDHHTLVSFARKQNIGETKVQEGLQKRQTHDKTAPSCKLAPLVSRTVTLDDIIYFIKSQKVFLKLDVESHEYFVIKGGKHLFKELQVVAIFMEWQHVKTTQEAKQLITLLNEYGYEAYKLGDMNLPLLNDEFLNWPLDIIWKKSER